MILAKILLYNISIDKSKKVTVFLLNTIKIYHGTDIAEIVAIIEFKLFSM